MGWAEHLHLDIPIILVSPFNYAETVDIILEGRAFYPFA